jgi:hypothetical protein
MSSACANCGETLAGEYCSGCGQRAVSLQRPAIDLLSDAVGDLLNLDTRLVRTLRPLLLTPGQAAKEYIAGRRVAYVPPLKAYLIAALIFFSLFTVFPGQAPVDYSSRLGRGKTAKSQRGSRTSFSFPAHISVYDDWYRARAPGPCVSPRRSRAPSRQHPRAFFVFLPLFAVPRTALPGRDYSWITRLLALLPRLRLRDVLAALPRPPAFLSCRASWTRDRAGLSLAGVVSADMLRRVYGGRAPPAPSSIASPVSPLRGHSLPLMMGAALLQFSADL